MSGETFVKTEKLAKDITDFVKSGSKRPVYTATVIENFAAKDINRATVKITLWDLIVGQQIRVDDKYELTVAE